MKSSVSSGKTKARRPVRDTDIIDIGPAPRRSSPLHFGQMVGLFAISTGSLIVGVPALILVLLVLYQVLAG
ncbi:hypothetical protein LBW59_03405 [Ralstonia solanacearum]|uniref:Transmembrane protein n=1 Tax=Ralstonia solanacearum TaxID=305 RepID=A0AAW5ZKM4_RALSL|nr:hypothetical protein [Ralstonia solanacearum]MDB0569820.1 hypothetical protein [Ralstonia solanacearum]